MKHWIPPPIWEGATAFLIGGGPSLRDQLPRLPGLLADRRVIGVNQAFRLGPWVDVCWFGDWRWFSWNLRALRAFPGLTVTCCNEFAQRNNGPGWVKVLGRGKPEGIEETPGLVAWNGNSGASAVSLARHLGARRVVLLGFDMRRTEGAPNDGHNWHGDHERHHTPPRDVYERRFLPRWAAVARDAERLGLEILNATPGSALEHFPRVALEDALGAGSP